jgi:hypothetical protein
MQPTRKPLTPFFGEESLIISRSGIKAPDGRSFTWGSVSTLKVVKSGWLLKLIFRQPKLYRLFLTTKAERMPSIIFETPDRALMNRVQDAINRAAGVVGGKQDM